MELVIFVFFFRLLYPICRSCCCPSLGRDRRGWLQDELSRERRMAGGGCVVGESVPAWACASPPRHNQPRGGMMEGVSGDRIVSAIRSCEPVPIPAAHPPSGPRPDTVFVSEISADNEAVSWARLGASIMAPAAKTSTPSPGTAGAPRGSASCRNCLRKSGKGAPIPNHRRKLTPTARQARVELVSRAPISVQVSSSAVSNQRRLETGVACSGLRLSAGLASARF